MMDKIKLPMGEESGRTGITYQFFLPCEFVFSDNL